MTTAILDLDYPKYAAACVGETRNIKVIHKSSGREKEFNNITEFWGRRKNHDGGWLGELNKGRESPFLPEEFDIIDQQKVTEPLQNILHSAKLMIDSSMSKIGADKYKAFMGEGECFRVTYSTLMEYKGQRKDLITPLLLDDVTEYLKKKYKPEVVTLLESDDACCIEAAKSKDNVIIGIDKDFYGCPVNFFNPNRESEGIVDCRGFGKLWLDGKKVRGIGRLFKYFQICSGDSVDNYKANCFSKVKWGDKNAYNVLSKCANDKEALTDMVNIFKILYPSPQKVIGWRGIEYNIDWKYVMNEMFNLAHIHRKKNDFININNLLNEMGISE